MPDIIKFKADPNRINPRDKSNLSWDVLRTNGVFLDGDTITWEEVVPVGDRTVRPSTYPITKYQLFAKDTGWISLDFDIKYADGTPMTDFVYTIRVGNEEREFFGTEHHPKEFEMDKGSYNFIVTEKNDAFYDVEEQGEVL